MTRPLAAALLVGILACRPTTLPASMSDGDFWALAQSLSEPAGAFPLSDNFVSNEPRFAESVRWIRPSGGVYVGVGPEQNFSYIARLRPATAFIIDIRRENRDLHLLYKALFELSIDRADFVSRLFSRPRPAGLVSSASVTEIFRRFSAVPPSAPQFQASLTQVRDWLVSHHALPLQPEEVASIERVFHAFYSDGPEIQFWGSRPADNEAPAPSYRQLMTSQDLSGQYRSFLADEDAFLAVKDLQTRNLILPIVGDFGGPSAIRRVGAYVRQHRNTIDAFYGSNVGVYLNTRQTRAFCDSLATLPMSGGAWFIESDGARPFAAKLKACAAKGKDSAGK